MISDLVAQEVKDRIAPKYDARLSYARDEAIVTVEPNNLLGLMRNLRDDTTTLFAMLVSICGVDNPKKEKRFSVIYNLLSLKFNSRIRVVVELKEKEEVPSVKDLFNSAGWFERETFDMYGIKFKDNNDLRRILTDYGFKHFPLRKDFPLTGYEEVRYDIEQKKIVYEPVKLDQEYRNFDFVSPWEGMTKQVLPGDEKVTK